MTDLQQNIATANRLAQEHAQIAQEKTKTWYDKKTKEKHFEPGDTVLVLVADVSRKMYARWSPPVTILRRLTNSILRLN